MNSFARETFRQDLWQKPKHCDFHDICGRINQEDVTDVKDSVYEEKLMEELTDRKEKK